MLTWPLLGLSSPLAGDLGNIPKLGSIHVEHQEGLSPFQEPLTHSAPEGQQGFVQTALHSPLQSVWLLTLQKGSHIPQEAFQNMHREWTKAA